MERSEIYTKINEIIVQVMPRAEETVSPSADLITHLGASSMDLVEIAIRIEKKFGFSVDAASAIKLHTIEELVDFVEKHKAGKTP
jgi:acyl carrier protein